MTLRFALALILAASALSLDASAQQRGRGNFGYGGITVYEQGAGRVDLDRATRQQVFAASGAWAASETHLAEALRLDPSLAAGKEVAQLRERLAGRR